MGQKERQAKENGLKEGQSPDYVGHDIMNFDESFRKRKICKQSMGTQKFRFDTNIVRNRVFKKHFTII